MPLLQTRPPPTLGRQPFSSEELAILRQYLEDFRAKTKEERKKLLMFEVYRLMKAKAPALLTDEQWKERKTVGACSSCCFSFDNLP
jgi:hypothetical protein